MQTKPLQVSENHVTIDAGLLRQILHRLDQLEEFIIKRRELAIIEMGHIETAYKMPKTREKRNG